MTQSCLRVSISDGYGSKVLNQVRCLTGVPEFPLIPGRDFSGVVMETGGAVPQKKFKAGEEVCYTDVIGTNIYYTITHLCGYPIWVH